MLDAVTIPFGEDEDEWLAMNTVDFFNELAVLFGVVEEDTKRITKKGDGFPDGFEYRWADGVGIKTPIKCTSTEYIDYVMTWVEGQMNNEAIFPTSANSPFPKKFKKYVEIIFKRLFRIFAILYSTHHDAISTNNADAHLNTCFRHFMYFVFVFHLVDAREFKALPGLTVRIRKEYKEMKHKRKEAYKMKKAREKKAAKSAKSQQSSKDRGSRK
jgi:MOB kinase activator 1